MLWREPMDLSLIAGTPFNCLVLDPASPPPSEVALAGARRAGFDVVALHAAPVTVLGDCPWPRVDAGGKNGATAGPTGLPWIETNGWRVRLARALTPDKTVWVRHAKLPEKTAVPLSSETYALAVADAAAHGGRWLVELDVELRRKLAAREPRGLAAWRELVSTAEFFERHADWASMQPQGALGIVSDFAGANEFIGTELLNLLGRRQVGYRIIPAQRASLDHARGLNALLYASQTAPSRELMVLFAAFAHAGGLAILPAAAASSVPQGVAEAGRARRFRGARRGAGTYRGGQTQLGRSVRGGARRPRAHEPPSRPHSPLQRALDEFLRHDFSRRRSSRGASSQLLDAPARLPCDPRGEKALSRRASLDARRERSG